MRNIDGTSQQCCPGSETPLVCGRNRLQTSREVQICSDTGMHPRISTAPKITHNSLCRMANTNFKKIYTIISRNKTGFLVFKLRNG